jgi:hypothetical protein
MNMIDRFTGRGCGVERLDPGVDAEAGWIGASHAIEVRCGGFQPAQRGAHDSL